MVDESKDDKEMRAMAEGEVELLKTNCQMRKLSYFYHEIRTTPDAIVEIRAGTGGDEAALFAANLFTMYQRLSSNMVGILRPWKFRKQE